MSVVVKVSGIKQSFQTACFAPDEPATFTNLTASLTLTILILMHFMHHSLADGCYWFLIVERTFISFLKASPRPPVPPFSSRLIPDRSSVARSCSWDKATITFRRHLRITKGGHTKTAFWFAHVSPLAAQWMDNPSETKCEKSITITFWSISTKFLWKHSDSNRPRTHSTVCQSEFCWHKAFHSPVIWLKVGPSHLGKLEQVTSHAAVLPLLTCTLKWRIT